MPAAPWLFRLAYFVFLILLFIHSFIRLFVGSFTYFAQVAMVIGELRCSVCGLVAWCGLLYSSIRFGGVPFKGGTLETGDRMMGGCEDGQMGKWEGGI